MIITKRIIAVFFIFLLLIAPSIIFAKEWKLSDKNLEVTFNDEAFLFTVHDKRCGKIWEQATGRNNFSIVKTVQNGNILTLSLQGIITMTAVVELTDESALSFTLSAAAKTGFKEIQFPASFQTPGKEYYILETDSEGLLLPVDDTEYPLGNGITYFCGGGQAMSWMGVTDKLFQTGYMALIETPYDAALRTKRENGLITFEPVWLPSKEQFGYTRKISYIFFDKGGYVAQCKRYRNYIWAKNKVESLKVKALKTPAIGRMVGGVHIYVWDNARNAAFSKELRDSGIDRAMFLWNPNHLPYPAKGYDDSLQAMGYAAGAYELFTDENLRDTAWYDLASSPTFLKRNAYPGLYNRLVARKKDGKAYTNQFGHFINPKSVLPEIQKRVSKEMAIWPHDTYFLDVYEANGLYESFSNEDPLTREQWADAIKTNQQYLIDTYHVFLGGEWGADFSGSQLSYVHGMMTLQRTWWGTEVGNKGSIYYGGDWKNGQRPTIMLGARTAPPKYMQYSINEAIRVPLYDLVYHDAIVTSWRWEDGNHHNPEIWWKKDLFNILYGSAPLWSVDRDRWESFKNTFIASYKAISAVLKQVGYDEMTDHRFISADHKIQETVFSSGKKVIVNFSDRAFEYEGKTVKPKGFIII